MLNELRELAVSLEKAGIVVEDLHPNFKACPNYPTFWAYLDGQGNMVSIAPVPKEQVSLVRKWEKANGVSFPAFNVPPLFKAASEALQDRIKTLKKNMEKGASIPSSDLPDVVLSCESLWDGSIIKKLTDCLNKPAAEILPFLAEPSTAYQAIFHLCKRMQLVKAETFKDQLLAALLQSLQNTPDPGLIDALFFYSGKTPKMVQIILELQDKGRFEYPANHQEVQRWMNRQFLTASSKTGLGKLDAFGCDAAGKDQKYPPVGFKNALGNVILRAMNQESPCQTRYGMIDYHSFPAGDEVRKAMKGALEWLGRDERKGKTWCDLSRRMEKPMLLFAYPSVLPNDLPDLAGMLGETEEDAAETNQERFATLAEKVSVALRGRSKETVDTEIRVFVLAKMDKARTKVLASNHYSAEHVIQSAEIWQTGCRNIPDIGIRCFGKSKGDKPLWAKPLVPFPAETVWCLNTVWMRQGSQGASVHGFNVNDALCLLLGDGLELRQTADRALGTVIRNSSSLLLSLGQAHALGLVHKTDKKYAKQPLLLPSLLGLLLHKLGHSKGEVMTSPAFLVGRLLNIADSLHLEYCRHVRNNSVPPQLVGNALMATAQEEPVKALSVLWGRIKPYHAWAQTLKVGEQVGLVRYFLKNLGDVSTQLDAAQLPQRCTDADKAQMLLGYLARLDSDNN